MSNKLKSTLLKILKIVGVTLAVILLLVVAAVYSLRFPAVQDYVVEKALNFYQSKVSAPASLGRLYVDFPSNVTIEDLYLEDTEGDTLLFAGYISAQTDLWALLDNKLHLSNVDLDQIVARVSRPKDDSLYNFQFIIDAFASNQKKDTTASKPFDFSLGQITLTNSNLDYQDGFTGIHAQTDLDQFVVSFDAFDIINKQMVAERIVLKGTRAKLNITSGNQAATSTSSSSSETEPFNFDAGLVEFSDVDFTLEDQQSMIKLVSDIGTLNLEVDSLNLANSIYTAKNIQLTNSFVSFDQFTGKSNGEEDVTTESTEPVKILAGASKFQLSNSSFRFHDHTDTVMKAGFDPTHFWLQKMEADLEDAYFKNGTVEGVVNNLAIVEKNGLTINQLRTEAFYGEKMAYAKALTLKTNRSFIKGDIKISYPSIGAIAEQPESLNFDIDLNDNKIHVADILYFQPALAKQLDFLNRRQEIRLSADVSGQLSDLRINQLFVKGLSNTELRLRGAISGLPNAQQAVYDLQLAKLKTSRKDIKLFVADTVIPAGLNLPEQLTAQMKVKGSLSNLKANGKLTTDLGNIDYAANLTQQPDSVYTYNGKIEAVEFGLDKLLNNNDLGQVSFNLEFDGKGFKPEEIDVDVKGDISALEYKNYTYTDIKVDAAGQNGTFNGELAIDDENVGFEMNAVVDMQDSIPNYQLIMDLDRADLYALNLSQEELKIRARLEANLDMKSLTSLKGRVNLDEAIISKNGTIYQIDTFALNAKSRQSITDIKLRSPIMDADFKGDFDLETLPGVIQNHFDHYLNLSDSVTEEDLQPQSFTFNIDFKNPVFFEDVLIPGLEEFDPVRVKGEYNSAEWLVNIDVLLNKINYQGTIVDSLDINLVSDKNTFDFKARAAQLNQSSFIFKNILVESQIAGDHIKADFKIKDESDSIRYHLGGRLFEKNDNYVFSFNKEEFILNYEPWKVAPQNELRISANYFWAEAMRFSNKNQEIELQSKVSQQQDTVLSTSFDRFDLGFLGKFKETEYLVLGGVLNGEVNYFTTKKSLNANLDIANFSYKGDTLGNIDLQASNSDNATQFDLAIKSGLNDVTAEGTITQNEQTVLDIQARINELNLSTIEKLAVNQVSELEGKISGQLDITGTVKKPDINGKLNFNETGLKVNYTGVKYHLNDETIAFNNDGLAFNTFTILDSEDDKLTIDGNIITQNYQNFNFDLTVNGSDFQLLKTTQKENDLVYGNLAINTKADITGTLKNPKVTVDLGVADGSEVTYTIPEEQISIQQREGVVQFFDQDLAEDDFFVQREAEEDTLEVFISGMDLRANIDVTKQSTFNVVIDPITNDQLSVSGDADLSLKMRPSGDMTLSGRYEVSEGSYQLNFYGLVKRRFEIQSGSYLLWTGDPLNAQMNVTATYSVRASAVDANVQRKIPFIVYLNLGGQLLSPDISFRLEAEQGEAPGAVQSWISGINQQESVLNQQVFSLLVFKTFTSSAFSGSGGGGAAQSTARSSVSRILSNQLNKLGQKIEGVELSFDLQSYQDQSAQGANGRTELELGLSKQFFDNRVIVKVAGDFDLEGSDAAQQQNASGFGGDIRIEYKLTEDGRFRLVGFRQNEYDNLLQGEIAETGVGIIFVRDYNSFKELFKKVDEEEGGNGE